MNASQRPPQSDRVALVGSYIDRPLYDKLAVRAQKLRITKGELVARMIERALRDEA